MSAPLSTPPTTKIATPAAMPEGNPSLRTIAMPADANPDGDIFGGCIMS